jgi:hypothetical protein
MALTPTQSSQLHTELTTDPLALNYAAHLATGDDGGLAALLNAPRAGQTCQSGSLTRQQVLGALTLSDLAAGKDGDFLAWVDQLCQMPVGLDLNNAKVQAVFTRFFASGTASFNALAALMQVSGCSRAQALFGVTCVIDAMTVARAMGR